VFSGFEQKAVEGICKVGLAFGCAISNDLFSRAKQYFIPTA